MNQGLALRSTVPERDIFWKEISSQIVTSGFHESGTDIQSTCKLCVNTSCRILNCPDILKIHARVQKATKTEQVFTVIYISCMVEAILQSESAYSHRMSFLQGVWSIEHLNKKQADDWFIHDLNNPRNSSIHLDEAPQASSCSSWQQRDAKAEHGSWKAAKQAQGRQPYETFPVLDGCVKVFFWTVLVNSLLDSRWFQFSTCCDVIAFW